MVVCRIAGRSFLITGVITIEREIDGTDPDCTEIVKITDNRKAILVLTFFKKDCGLLGN